MARQKGFEPLAYCLEGSCSILLSYRIMYLKCLRQISGWLGRLDSNQRMRESKSLALPLGDAPMWKEAGDRGYPDPLFFFPHWGVAKW